MTTSEALRRWRPGGGASTKVARRVPRFSWSAPAIWRPTPTSFGVLIGGLVLFGVGDWMLIASRFGNAPWSVLSGGIDNHLGWGIGTVTIVVSIVVLIAWIPFRQRPGLGTIANALVIGTTVEALERSVDPIDGLVVRVVMLVGGLLLVGGAGALYLSAQHGPGPRDGLMTGIARRFDWPIATVRLTIEVSVMLVGWLLGGRIGIGTIAFAATIGHTLAWCVERLHRFDGRRDRRLGQAEITS